MNRNIISFLALVAFMSSASPQAAPPVPSEITLIRDGYLRMALSYAEREVE
jgi:hypothetical protein